MIPSLTSLRALATPRTFAAILVSFALVVIGAQLFNPPRGDDLAYLRWAAERAWDPWTPMFRPPPFPGWRPANAFVWWLSVSMEGVGGWLPQVSLVGLWSLALFAGWGWARGRWGGAAGLWTVAFFLATDRFRELLIWRSWLTSTGSVAFLLLTLWALERKRGALALVLGAIAVCFKETAAPPLIVAAIFVYGRPAIAVGIFVAALPGVAKAILDAGLFAPGQGTAWNVAERATTYAMWFLRSGWLPVMTVGLALHGVGDGGNGGDSGKQDRRWLAVAGAALVAPAIYRVANPTYLLEALVVLAGLAAAAVHQGGRGRLAAVALVASLYTLPGTLLDGRWQNRQWFLASAAYSELVAAAPKGWTVADGESGPSDEARWFGLRLRFDRGVPEGVGCAEVVAGVEVCR